MDCAASYVGNREVSGVQPNEPAKANFGDSAESLTRNQIIGMVGGTIILALAWPSLSRALFWLGDLIASALGISATPVF